MPPGWCFEFVAKWDQRQPDKATAAVKADMANIRAHYETYNLLEHLSAASVLTADFLAAVPPGRPHALLTEAYDSARAKTLSDPMLALDVQAHHGRQRSSVADVYVRTGRRLAAAPQIASHRAPEFHRQPAQRPHAELCRLLRHRGADSSADGIMVREARMNDRVPQFFRTKMRFQWVTAKDVEFRRGLNRRSGEHLTL